MSGSTTTPASTMIASAVRSRSLASTGAWRMMARCVMGSSPERIARLDQPGSQAGTSARTEYRGPDARPYAMKSRMINGGPRHGPGC